MSGHTTKVEEARFRVVCLECTWFKYATGATIKKLREIGRSHTSATTER